MKKTSIIYQGTKVLFIKRNMNYDDKMCPLCGKKISKGLSVYLIVNNYVLFPNVFVHSKCVPSEKEYIKPKEECVKQLTSSYTKFRNFLKRNKFWYNSQCF